MRRLILCLALASFAGQAFAANHHHRGTSTYTVTPSAGAGGSMSPNTPQTVHSGNTTTFLVTPRSGYKLASATGCAGTLSGTTYTTGPVTANCSVSTSFAASAASYTVTPSAGTGGTISPATAQTVTANGTISFTVTPKTGYQMASVAGCGGKLSGNTYSTGPISAACTVSAAFTATSATYTVTPTAGTGGSISPSTPQTVTSGKTTSLTVTPKSGYQISAVTGCAGTLSGSSYTTGSVTANCAVSATFSTTQAGTGGDHYVLKGATGSNNGSSWTNAWTELNQINWSSVACGDTVWIGGGTYTTGLTINKTCTASTPLTVQSVVSTDSGPTTAAGYTSAVLNKVVIVNSGVNLSAGAYVTLSGRGGTPAGNNFGISVQCNNTAGLGGCNAFSGAGSGSLNNFTVSYVEMYGPPCVLAENCGGGGASGFNVAPSNNKVTNLLLDHDWIHQWGEAIRTCNWSNAIIQYTDIDTTHNDGQQHEDVMYNYAQTNLTMRYNRIWNSPNDGIFFDFGGTNGFYFYGNVFYDAGGEYIVFKPGYTNATNVYIYNNDFEGNGNGDYSYGWLDLTGASTTSGAVQNNVFENVAVVNNTMPSPNYNAYSVSAYKDTGAQSFVYTPGTQFVNEPDPNDPPAADFHLTSAGNTTFGRGVALPTPYNQNPDGAARGANGVWQIGAY